MDNLKEKTAKSIAWGAVNYATLAISNLWLLLLARMVMAAVLYFVAMRLFNVAILQECLQFIKSKKVKE